MNIFESSAVKRAFGQAEKLLGSQPFTLVDGRTLRGVGNRVHVGETILPNGERIKADCILVATRGQFTPAGGQESLPAPLSRLEFQGVRWRAEYVASDECHVTLYLCKNP